MADNNANSQEHPITGADAQMVNHIAANYDNVISNSAFKTPDMGDFYLGAVDCTFLNKIDEMVNGEENADHEKAAFYAESPKKDVGTNDENEAFVYSKIDIPQETIDKGYNNGNTLRVKIASMQGPNSAEIKESIQQKVYDKCANINIRLVGISAPQTPVWAYEKNVPVANLEKRIKKYGEVKNSDSYVIASGAHHDDGAQITFISIGDVWHEIDSMGEDGKTMSFRWCVLAGDEDSIGSFNEDKGETRYDAGDMKAALNLKRLIEDANGDIYFDIDKSANGFGPRFKDISNDPKAMAMLKSWHEAGGSANDGYTIVMEDKSANFMAVAYIKRADKWINLAKAALTDDSNQTIAPDTSYDGKLKETFKPNRYDKEAITYADAYYKTLSALDDRKKIQQQVLGMDWQSLHKWTMTLGDITFFVPPMNFSITTETEKQEMPLLRANGSMHKVGKRTKRSMSMNLYFNEDRGINGYKIEDKTPGGQKLTFSINGLRALIAQFKFIPFIPIENDYVNNTLHIQAVTVENLVIKSVPNFPRLIQATILMTEFNYGVYIPEAITAGMSADSSEDSESFKNYFANSFNWKTARWYYQRALMKGDAMKGMKFNSDEYNYRMIQNRTALIPMSFMNPNITFFLANAEYLDEMIQARMQKKKRAIKFDKYEREGLEKLGIISDCVTAAQNDSEFQAEIEYLSKNFKYFNNVSGDTREDWISDAADTLSGWDRGFITRPGISNRESDKAFGSDEEEATKHLNNALAILKAHVEEANEKAGEQILSNPRFVHYTSGSGDTCRASWGLSYLVDIDAIDDQDKQDEIKANLAAYLGCGKDDFYKNKRIYLPISATYKPDTEGGSGSGEITSIEFDTSYPDVMFLAECKEQSKADPDKKSYAQTNLKQLENLYYDKYVTARVENWSASLTNHISRMNVCDLSGSSPQYLGGNDIQISLDIVTTNKDAVEKLNAMPTICAAFGRKYRAVMPSSVLKAQAEFIQFLGVNEVLINDVQIDTVPNQPGVWRIHVDMTSDDRTLRTREALDKIEGSNAGVVGSSGDTFSDIMGWNYSQTGAPLQSDNRHSPQEDSLAARNMQTYFDLNKTIAKAELYPDLELPTLDEMENMGWDFVRYKFQDDRVYVDPDFYFIYPNNLSSQILREFILAKAEGEEAQISYRDSQGGQMTIEPATRKGFNILSRNAIAQAQKDKSVQLQNAQNNAKAKKIQDNADEVADTGALADAMASNNFESWEICDDIKASFMEDKYKKEYDAYQAHVHAKSVLSNQEGAQTPGDTVENTSNQEGVQTPGGTVENTTAAAEPEGKWVNNQLAQARRASGLIEQYLNNTEIKDDVPDAPMIADERAVVRAEQKAAETAAMSEEEKKQQAMGDAVQAAIRSGGQSLPNGNNSQGNGMPADSTGVRSDKNSRMQTAIQNGVAQFFNDGDIIEIFSCINADVSDGKFLAIAKDIVYSAACAATGEKEYSNKQKSTGWMPNPDFFGYKIGSGQDAANREQAHNTEEALEYATEFGCFGIKQYARGEFQSITGEEAVDIGNNDDLNATHYLIDPFYRVKSEKDLEKVKNYKKGCINNPTYCTTAYLRLCLYWLKKLIDCQAYPSMSADILRNSVDHELSILQQSQQNGALNVKDSQMLEHITFFKKRSYALDSGKVWAAAVLASGEGNPTIMQRIQSRDYRALNGYISGLSRPQNSISTEDKQSLMTRKMVLALIGTGRIKGADAIGVPQDKEASQYMSDTNEKKYIEAAEDPATYCMHACHDMIVYDARGRMLRAFPTYYMLFIDEGREVGMWKLHDNFYNSMAIASIEVVKSRKMPADTAHIVMSNFYKSFMTEGDDYSQANKVQNASWNDTFASVFGPIPGVNKVVGAITGQDLDSTTYGQRLEAERKKKPPEDRVRLRPGARIHIRMGYGSNAVMLPVVFNGAIAEVTSQEAVEIVAQGDGIELMNPIMEDGDDAADTVHEDEFVCLPSNGETPKNIVNAYLTNIGGKAARALKAVGAQNLLGRSPYGIYHFGNPDYKELFSKGEPTQNIFESCAKPAWGSDSSATASYGLDAAPKITFDTFQKTVWDVTNICRSTTPDFICGVAPFDYRSTLFMGHPRYYYAYTYSNNDGLGIQERRKPYQQFHIYDSSSDIIGNGIIATKSRMKTVALGLYTKVESLNIKNQEKVGPLYADIDIYPENQKTMIVDTQLMGKGPSVFGTITNSVSQRFDSIKGENSSHEKIAWRMTASALKDSVKEMYAGDLVVIGDPSVKPHDRISIADTYQGISGQATVKEVVLSMSIDNGFTTTISPDCICTVDDRFENVVQPTFGRWTMVAHAAIGTVAMNAVLLLAGKKAGTAFLSSKGLVRGALKTGSKLNPLNKSLVKDTKAAKAIVKGAKKAKKAISGAKIVASAATIGAEVLAGPVGWAALGIEVLGLVGSVAFGAFVDAFLEMTMKNLQVLQIYPLKRYGLCWTAGVEGSKGLVVGSPSHNQQGALTKTMSNLFGSDPNGLLGGLGGLLVGDEVTAIADRYNQQLNITDDEGNGTNTDTDYGDVITRQSMQNGDIPNDYRGMELIPRVVYDKNSNDFQQTREHFAIMNKDNWMNDSRLQHVKLISQDPRLKPYMEEVPRFFRIVHEEPALNKDSGQVDTLTLSKNGARYYIKAMHQPLANGGECLDVPMLHEEALNILYEIVRRAKGNMDKSLDRNENYEQIKGSFIALESALRIGDNESMGATGFTFILEGSGKAAAPMASAITELMKEVAEDAEKNDMCNRQIFTCQPQGSNKVAINVLMPKLTDDKFKQAEGDAV